MPQRGLPTDAAGTPDSKAQQSFTDPDSHIIKSGVGYIQGFNAQGEVVGDHQVIVAIGVSNQPPDIEHHDHMLERICANMVAIPKVVIEDVGYWSEDRDNFKTCQARGIDSYIATGRQKHGQRPPPARGPIPKSLNAKGRMAGKLRRRVSRSMRSARRSSSPPT